MTNPTHAGRMLFVNLPVADLERSKTFFAEVFLGGFAFYPPFTDDIPPPSSACSSASRPSSCCSPAKRVFEQFRLSCPHRPPR